MRATRTLPTSLAVVAALSTGLALTPPTEAAPTTQSAPSPDRPSVRLVRDPLRDVELTRNDGTVRAAPGRRDGDVRRLRVAHRADAVRVRFDLAGLRVHHGLTEAVAFVRTPDGAFVASLVATPRRPQGQAEVLREAGGDSVACPGLHTRIGYAADVVRLVVPRSCLDEPRWVRVQAVVSTVGPRDRFHTDVVPGAGRLVDRYLPRAWSPGA